MHWHNIFLVVNKMKSILKNCRALSGAAAAVIIVAMLMLTAVVGVGFYTNWKFQLNPNPNPNPTGQPTGSFTIHATASDSLAPTTARVIATDASIIYYVKIGGAWISTGVAATTGSYDTVTLAGTEGGIIYAVVTTSSSYYIDSAKTTAMCSKIASSAAYGGTVTFQNVIGTQTVAQWVFPIDMHGVTPGVRDTADLVWNVYLITYDASFTFGTAAANQTSIGTALNTTYIGWYAVASAANKGVAIKQMTISVNDSSTTAETFYKQNIPGVGNLQGGAFQVTPSSSSIIYSWTAPVNPITGAVDLESCIYWTFASGGFNKFDLQTGIQFTLPATRTEAWTITIYWLTPAGVGGSATQPWQGAA